MSENITNNPSVPSQVVAEVKFPRFINNLGIIPTSYKDSMSYYECLAWLCKFLEETVIPTVNQNGKATEELQALYVQLNSYVTNYFDNLDVQEEINNKLDEMVEQGTLQEIVGEYLKATAIWGFDTVSDMKDSTNLINGSFAKTLGYYAKNDGGEAIYKIRTITNDDVVDEKFIISLNEATNTLIAELVCDNYVNLKQIGAKGNKTDNDTAYFTAGINYLKNKNGGTLYIPKGQYLVDSIPLKNRISIIGDSSYNSVIYASNVSTHLFYIDDAPVQQVEYKGFSMYNETNNNTMIGMDLTGIESATTPYQGGIWYTTFNDIKIQGFKIGLKLQATDVQGDVANQFLTFNQVRIYRNGLSNEEMCAWLDGQLGQTIFNNCDFSSRDLNSATYKNAPGTNVKLGGTSMTTDTSFNMCTFQNSAIGVDASTNLVTFENCWFENIGQSIIIQNTSKGSARYCNFANAGGNSDNTGFIMKGNASALIELSENRIAGRVDKLIDAPYARGIKNEKNYSTASTTGLLRQVSINAETHAITSYGNEFLLVNIASNNSQLDTIDSTLSTLEEITIIANGEQTSGKSITITSSGNIVTPRLENITIHNRDVIKLKKGDTVNKWILSSLVKVPLKASSIPSTAFPNAKFEKGEIVYNSNPASTGYVGWVCTTAGTPGTWAGFGTIG